MKISTYFCGGFSLAGALFAVGCAVTHTDYVQEETPAFADVDSAVIRFRFAEYAMDPIRPVDWSTPTYSAAPSTAAAGAPRPLPVLYRTSVELTPTQNAMDNTLIFDAIEAQGSAMCVNGRLVHKEFIDTARPIYNLNPYLKEGDNEIILLCVPNAEIGTSTPLMLQNARLSMGKDSEVALTWDYAPAIAGVTQKWYNPAEAETNSWAPWYAISRMFEFYRPAPPSVEPTWLTADLDPRPIEYNIPRDVMANYTNYTHWTSLANWYKLEFKVPENTQKNWRLTLQSAGDGYLWLNGIRRAPSSAGKQIVSFNFAPSDFQSGTNSIVICLLPLDGVPGLIAAELRPE